MLDIFNQNQTFIYLLPSKTIVNRPQLYKQNERFFYNYERKLWEMRRVAHPLLPVVSEKEPTMGGIVPPSPCCYKQK
jgi:hypothetical protein